MLVLGLSDDQCPLPISLAHDEVEPANGRVDRDQGCGSVIIAARGHRAAPSAEIEHRRTILGTNPQLAKGGGNVASSELAGDGSICRNDQALAVLGDAGASLR